MGLAHLVRVAAIIWLTLRIFEEGRIVEEGAHASLLGWDSLYRHLFTTQASGLKEAI